MPKYYIAAMRGRCEIMGSHDGQALIETSKNPRDAVAWQLCLQGEFDGGPAVSARASHWRLVDESNRIIAIALNPLTAGIYTAEDINDKTQANAA